MISKKETEDVFVWVWLPGAVQPVVAGRLEKREKRYVFNYGRNYLSAKGSISLYLPELPLEGGAIEPPNGMWMAGCLQDGAPDAWGRRVIVNRLLGQKGEKLNVDALDEITYLLESGSDRIGALDFQSSASDYQERKGGEVSLEELLTIAEMVEKGVPITPELERAVFHGTSLGGARPKASIETEDKKYIAKFSSSTDVTNVVKGEFVAMRLARAVGLNVAEVKLTRAGGKDVLLIERFDRARVRTGWTRKGVVSGLTLLGLDEMMGRYASYQDLAEIMRARFSEPKATLREFYGRMVFNVLCGNTDDHARNHAAFWDGRYLELTPGYDICPQNRAGWEANQAMLIAGDEKSSRLVTCLKVAADFLLSEAEAIDLIAAQIEGVRGAWEQIVEEGELSQVDRAVLMGRQILNPYLFEEAPAELAGG